MVTLAEPAFHTPAHAILVDVPSIFSENGLKVGARQPNPNPPRARTDFNFEIDFSTRYSQIRRSHGGQLTADPLHSTLSYSFLGIET